MNSPRLLCLGRLIPAKGFDMALTAFSTLTGRYPDVRLTIAGDGAVRGELERQAADLGLADAVEFTGWVAPDQIPALLNTATIVLMPSRHEGLPIVAVQSALMARPIVATRVSGLPEVVVGGQTGLLIEKDDSQSLAQAIAYLLDHPETAQRMGREGRRHARAVFDWERCVDAYDTLYRRLVKA